MAAPDYYKILGVPKTATQDEIRLAFRKKARAHHPDLHPEKEKAKHTQAMQEINEAYTVLGSPDKRTKYDRYGADWEQAAQAEAQGRASQPAGGAKTWRSQNVDPGAFSDFFKDLFGGETGGFDGAWQTDFQNQAGRDIEAELELSLEDAIKGKESSFTLPASGLCPTCHGTGRLNGQACPLCGGVGEIRQPRTITAKIPPIVADGTLLRLKGQGDAGPDGKRGDLYLRVRLKADPRFVIKGSDVETTARVVPWEAALGGEMLVPTIEGSLRIKIPKGSHTGQRLRLAGRGLGRKGGGRGDQYVRLEVDNPEPLSPKAEALYQQLKEEHDGASRPR